MHERGFAVKAGALFLFTGIFFFSSASHASAATYYVNNSGSPYIGAQGAYGVGNDTTGNGSLLTPWATMNKANTAASLGDTIYVAKGTYSETVSGNYWALIFKDGVNWTADGNVIVEESAGTANYSAVSIAGTTATIITGFTFDGLNQKSYVLYPQSNTANKAFVNCTFQNSVNFQVYLNSSNHAGFSFSGSTFMTAAAGKSNIETYFPISVTGSTFTSTTGAAFLNSYSTSGITTLTNNTFTANYGTIMAGIGIYGTGSTYNIGTQESPNTFILTSFVGELIYANVAAGNIVNVIGNTFNVYSAPAQASLIFYYGASATQGTSTVTYNTLNVLSSGSGGSGATNSFAFLYAHANSTHEFDWLLDIEHNTLNINNNCATNSAGSSYLISLFDQPRAATIAYNTFSIADTSGGACVAVWISSGITGYMNGAHTISHNTITTNSLLGYGIDVGYDGGYTYNHNISGVTISYNTITGVIGLSASVPTHLILYAYADNGLIHHNLLIGGAYGVVIKGGNEGGANNWITGKLYDNIMLSQNTSAIYVKGVQNVPIYNNTAYEIGTYAAAHGALYVTTYDNNDPTGTIAENNLWYASTYGVWWDGTGSLTSDYNLYYIPGGSYGYINTTIYPTLVGWQGVGYDAHSTSFDPLFTDAVNTNFTLQGTSPAIDAGTSVGLSSDYADTTSIYGTPDIGAYEYQPPYTLTTSIPTTGSTRLYTNGKYRALTATTSSATSALSVTPAGGFYTASTSKYMDITVNDWTAATKQWTATSTTDAFSTHATSTVYTIADLTPSTDYAFDLDNVPSTALTSSACSGNICTSDGSGSLTFTYTGGYSTHTFSLTTRPMLSGNMGGTLGTGQTITLSTDGSIIRYTLDLSTPDCSNGTLYTGPFTISGNVTVNAVACDASGNASAISSAAYSPIWGSSYVESSRPTQIATTTPVIAPATTPITLTPAITNTSSINSGLSPVQISSILSLLISFGADATTIASVQAALRGAVGTSTPTTRFSFTHNLSLHDTGADVKTLQQYLNTHGFTVSEQGGETSYFGIKTYTALLRFQKSQGLPVTGYFGPQTRQILSR